MKPPTWSTLRRLGDSKLLRSSFVWLLVVPVLAKGIDALPETLRGMLVGLPFSWKVFYFAAIFTALGNLIYVLRCPNIVRSYSSFVDLQLQGKGTE